MLSPSSPISAAALYTNDRQSPTATTEPRLEEWVDAPLGDRPSDRLGIEVVTPDEHVQPGRVATAHLQPIDRGERLLDREVRPRPPSTARDRRARRRAGGAESIVADRPERILEIDETGVGQLECAASRPGGVGVEWRFDVRGDRVELIEPGRRSRRRGRRARRGRGRRAGRAAARRPRRPAPRRRRRRAPGQRRVEPPDDLVGARSRPGRRTADDADDATHARVGGRLTIPHDAAHGPPGYRPCRSSGPSAGHASGGSPRRGVGDAVGLLASVPRPSPGRAARCRWREPGPGRDRRARPRPRRCRSASSSATSGTRSRHAR